MFQSINRIALVGCLVVKFIGRHILKGSLEVRAGTLNDSVFKLGGNLDLSGNWQHWFELASVGKLDQFLTCSIHLRNSRYVITLPNKYLLSESPAAGSNHPLHYLLQKKKMALAQCSLTVLDCLGVRLFYNVLSHLSSFSLSDVALTNPSSLTNSSSTLFKTFVL